MEIGVIKDKKVIQLFTTFFKIGIFTFGGGYAMISLLQKEVVEKKGWFTDHDISDVVAIAETTPGPIAINMATFVGYKIKGVKGAIAATFGVVLPSFLILFLIAMAFQKYMDQKIVQKAFWGIRIAVIGLMLKAFAIISKQCPKNTVSYGIAVVVMIMVAVMKINALLIIFGVLLVGIVYGEVKAGKKK